MKRIRDIHKYIPGFRQLSPASMMIAGTYYGASTLITFKYWYWGLALLALPFLIFYLLDLNATKRKRLSLAFAAAAGLAVLLGAAVGLSTGGLPGNDTGSFRPYASPAGTQATPVASPAAATPAPSPAPAPSAVSTVPPEAPSAPAIESPPAPAGSPDAAAAPAADTAQYAYVAAKGGEVFHLPGCSSAKRIKPENLIGFKTREEAVAAGLRPCKRCNP